MKGSKERTLPFHPCVSRKCMENLITNFPKAEFTSDIVNVGKLVKLSIIVSITFLIGTFILVVQKIISVANVYSTN